jgi:hypothetical protein
MRNLDPSHVRSRMIIHAGFAKCGSASIRTALFQNFHKLQKHDVSVFGKDLRIARATWKSALPAARVCVRFLIPELQTGGNPANDFFHLLGLSQNKYDIENEHRNPSLDVSVLDVLSKNPHLFSGVHDNDLTLALTRALSKKFRSTNIQMLSLEEEARIEKCFRDENLWLLNTYCSGIDVDHIYRAHFTPRDGEIRYSSMGEIDLIYRCLGIILESIAFSGGQVTADDSRIPTPNTFGVKKE